MYRECLMDEFSTMARYHQIVSVNHVLGTHQIVKSALSPFDDKRFLLEGTTDTLAYGHYKIRDIRQEAVVENIS